MKKSNVSVFLAATILMVACNKMDNNVNKNPKPDNYAMVGNSFSKEDGPIEITYRVGHDASECNYSCVILNGIAGHADCQGFGEACVITIRLWPIGGQPKGGTFSAVVDTVWSLTTEDFFNMPDRSLTVLDATSENQAYLNIPAQLVYLDSATHQFTFTGLFYSDKAAYCNN
jgi:hypothetical protein